MSYDVVDKKNTMLGSCKKMFSNMLTRVKCIFGVRYISACKA